MWGGGGNCVWRGRRSESYFHIFHYVNLMNLNYPGGGGGRRMSLIADALLKVLRVKFLYSLQSLIIKHDHIC